MAEKKTIFAGEYQYRADIIDDIYALGSLTGSQQQSVLLCLTGLLPAKVKIEQRSALGPIDLTVDNFCFKINQRAKITQRHEVLP
jgi:hypothetical protein